MSIGKLFLKAVTSGVISEEELIWITSNQYSFSRCEEATALRLGRMFDHEQINLGCRI